MKNYYIRLAITLCFLVASSYTSFAATVTWVGNNNNWNDPANWSSGTVPVAADDVIINKVTSPKVPPSIINTAVVRTGTTTVNIGTRFGLGTVSGGSFTNNGILTINGGIGVANITSLDLGNGFPVINNGTINVTNWGNFSSSGSFTNSSTGIINLAGSASNYSGFAIYSMSTFTNNGTINLSRFSFIHNYGILNNNGSLNSVVPNTPEEIIFSNQGTISGSGTFTNKGTYDSNGNCTMNSAFINAPSGLLGNSGAIECMFFNNGLTNNGIMIFSIDVGVSCTNFDKMTVTGTAALGGTFEVYELVDPLDLNTEYLVLTATTNISGSFTNTYYDVTNGYAVPIINNSVSPKTLKIKIQATTALPIELVSFKGEKRNRENILFWETASETNNRGFDVEISNDGSHFEKIAFVAGHGTTSNLQNYNFRHTLNAKQNNILYYRLKQLDNDGKFEYSKIIVLENGHNTNLVAYPNPSKGEFTLLGIIDENATYEVFNAVGKTINATIENNQLNLTDQPSGVYYLKINEQVVKLVKKY